MSRCLSAYCESLFAVGGVLVAQAVVVSSKGRNCVYQLSAEVASLHCNFASFFYNVMGIPSFTAL